MAKYCKYCNSKMKLNSSKCPNCGKINNKEEKTTIEIEKKLSYPALYGFILSTFSCLLNLCRHGWVLFALVGICLSIYSIRDVNRNSLRGKGFAYAGVVLGVISFIYCMLFWWY